MKDEMFEMWMNTTGSSVVFKDLDGKYLAVSAKKAATWKLSRDEMLGKTDFDFMSPEEAIRARMNSLSVIQTGVSIEDRIVEAVRNNQIIFYSLSEHIWYGNDGVLRGTRSESKDITELIESKKQAETMTEQVLDMVTIVSHDLAGPLISVDAGIKLVMRNFYGKVSRKVYDALNDLHERLLCQRGAVLDYLHKFAVLNGNQRIEKERIDLRVDVIEEVLEELEIDIKKNKSLIDSSFGLIPQGAVVLFSDKITLKITYRNLIMNALKYGGEGCVISFGFENKGDRFWLNVYNNGPAVPEDEIADLFEPFVQGRNVSKGKGLGIGLYTIKKMIRFLGGNMWYETTLSGHPNFIFEITK